MEPRRSSRSTPKVDKPDGLPLCKNGCKKIAYLKDSVWLPICQGCYRKGLAQNEESVQEAEQAMRDYQTSRTRRQF